MSPLKEGERVGAIAYTEVQEGKKVIYMYGYGTYAGYHTPPESVTFMGMPLTNNPKIELDNGKVVWGCECWWGSEEEVKKWCEGKEVIELDIEEERVESSAHFARAGQAGN